MIAMASSVPGSVSIMTFLGVEGEIVDGLTAGDDATADELEARAGIVQRNCKVRRHGSTSKRVLNDVESERTKKLEENEYASAGREPPRAQIEKFPPNFPAERQII